jgi:cell wall-associated NlpC family hydrolase
VLAPANARVRPPRRGLLVGTLLAAVVVPCALLARPVSAPQPDTLVAARSGAVQPTALHFSDHVAMREPVAAVRGVTRPAAVVRATRSRQLPARPAARVAPRPVVAAPPSTGSLVQRVLAEARRHRGAPYLYGAAGPNRFDCSGFTMYVFGRFGIHLPHSSSAQYGVTTHLADAAKRPGDLIFTYHGGSIGHVGIYAGGTLMWASVQTGDVVRLEDFGGRAYSVGRVI